ncbi:peptide-methionine (S)-S-oxide reductase MsrA [Rhodoferax ferrireducens]|uniref:peptide-methionine (S)-S-oxide reductase MsrA n=1 Tax=Rhodoferax ferrireducens TaxID=192843 RepID=UPI001E49978E|nr:peptide-methionine (S)-S-oxide reductase MsrA [Rhodoferax ferrireducens]
MNTQNSVTSFLHAAGTAALLSLAMLSSAHVIAQGSTTGAAPVAAPAVTAKAVFAGGCFWCVESDFDKIPGVISTTSGYTGGQTVKPSYEQVSSHTTGHAEAVEVVFDPARVSYQRLVEYFWHTIDPTVKDRQFCDIGSPYRTAIFAQDAEQLKTAQASRAALEKSKPFKEPIVTEIVLANAFYPAEEYHQNYYKKNPIRYKYYRSSCGRDARLKQLWGEQAGH